MGSFNSTCAISNLPIKAGDDVRYLILAEYPYASDSNNACTPFDRWVPRTFPIKGKYNDYGGIEDEEKGIGPELWLEGLKHDLIPRGWGDNSVHDTPTSKDMNWGQLLDGLQGGRLQVDSTKSAGLDPIRRALDKANALLGKKPVTDDDLFRVKEDDGVPRLEAIQKILADQPEFAGWGKDGFMVDEVSRAIVRVRWHGHDGTTTKHLKAAQKLLKGYATVLASGSGSYSDRAELIVLAKPGVHCGRGLRNLYPPQNLQAMMIREDVWQVLLTLDTAEYSHWDNGESSRKDNHGLDDFKAAVGTEYGKQLVEMRKLNELDSKTDAEMMTDLLFRSMPTTPSDNPLIWPLMDRMGPTFGMREHWNLLVEKALPIEEVSDTLNAVAEMLHVRMALMFIRYLWVPSHTVGPQEGDFNMHRAFHLKLASLASQRHQEERAEMDDYE